MFSHILLEQNDIRAQVGSTNMKIGSNGGLVYLKGQIAAGGVVITQPALGNASTAIYLRIIQR